MSESNNDLLSVIERAKREWERTFDVIPDLIAIIDNAGRIVRANRAVAKVFGLPITEIPGRFWRDIFPAEKSSGPSPQVSSPPAGLPHSVEVRIAGQKRKYLLTTAPFRDETGQPAGVVQVARDITEQAVMEAQIRQLQKMESLGRLAGGIAHEFGNILTAVGCDIQMIQRRLGPEHPSRLEIEEVIRSVTRATDLTRRLSEFSRMGDERPEEVDCNELISSMEGLLRGVIRKNISLGFTFSSLPALVRIDRDALEQAIITLVINARDAMPDGGNLFLSTAVERGEGPGPLPLRGRGEYVVIEVRDNGVGMEPEVLSRVFEPFFFIRERDKAPGLGLSVVYGTMRRAGGAVTVESEPGEGSVFKIYLPRTARSAG